MSFVAVNQLHHLANQFAKLDKRQQHHILVTGLSVAASLSVIYFLSSRNAIANNQSAPRIVDGSVIPSSLYSSKEEEEVDHMSNEEVVGPSKIDSDDVVESSVSLESELDNRETIISDEVAMPVSIPSMEEEEAEEAEEVEEAEAKIDEDEDNGRMVSLESNNPIDSSGGDLVLVESVTTVEDEDPKIGDAVVEGDISLVSELEHDSRENEELVSSTEITTLEEKQTKPEEEKAPEAADEEILIDMEPSMNTNDLKEEPALAKAEPEEKEHLEIQTESDSETAATNVKTESEMATVASTAETSIGTSFSFETLAPEEGVAKEQAPKRIDDSKKHKATLMSGLKLTRMGSNASVASSQGSSGSGFMKGIRRRLNKFSKKSLPQ